MAWVLPAAGAALQLLQNRQQRKQQRAQNELNRRMAQAKARWSGFTGDQSWAGDARRSQTALPNSLNALLQGGMSGYQFGQSLQNAKQMSQAADLENQLQRARIRRLDNYA